MAVLCTATTWNVCRNIARLWLSPVGGGESHARAAPTVDDLAAALDVSQATLKCGLAALRRAGHEVRTRDSKP